MLADADADRLNNFEEYAWARNPRSADNVSLTTASIVNDGGTNYLAVTFKRPHKALDVTYTVQTSDNLATGPWTPTTNQFGPTLDLGGGAEQVTFRDTAALSTTTRFIRVRATKP